MLSALVPLIVGGIVLVLLKRAELPTTSGIEKVDTGNVLPHSPTTHVGIAFRTSAAKPSDKKATVTVKCAGEVAKLYRDEHRSLQHERLLVVPRDAVKNGIVLSFECGEHTTTTKIHSGETTSVVVGDVEFSLYVSTTDDDDVVQQPTWTGMSEVELSHGACLHVEEGDAPVLLCIPGRNDAVTNSALRDTVMDRGWRLAVLYYRGLGPGRVNKSSIFNSHWAYGTSSKFFDDDMEDALRHLGQVHVYAHSTGCLLLASYLDRKGDESIMSFVLSGPFFDWGWDMPVDPAENVLGRAGLRALSFVKRQHGVRVLSRGDLSERSSSRSAMHFQYPSTPVLRPLHEVAVTHNFVRGCTGILRRIKRRREALSHKPTLIIVSDDDLTLRADDIAEEARLFEQSEVEHMTYARHDALNSVFVSTSTKALNRVIDFWTANF